MLLRDSLDDCEACLWSQYIFDDVVVSQDFSGWIIPGVLVVFLYFFHLRKRSVPENHPKISLVKRSLIFPGNRGCDLFGLSLLLLSVPRDKTCIGCDGAAVSVYLN